MTEICIRPIFGWMKKTPRWLWPSIPPIFQDCPESGPTEDDRNLAKELFAALDTESKSWYIKQVHWLAEKPFEKPRKSKKSKVTRKENYYEKTKN